MLYANLIASVAARFDITEPLRCKQSTYWQLLSGNYCPSADNTLHALTELLKSLNVMVSDTSIKDHVNREQNKDQIVNTVNIMLVLRN